MTAAETPGGERSARSMYFVALAAIAIAAFVVVLLATRRGISTSPDSARYVRSARHVLGREVHVETGIEAKAEQAHFPPMYSTVLALLSLAGGTDPLIAARWLHAFLLAGNAVIAAELVRRTAGSASAALFTAAVAAFSHASLYIHTLALSEPLFVFFSLLSLGLLAGHLRRPRWALLIGSAVLAGTGVLTRYAGWAILPAALACLLVLAPAERPLRRRIIDMIVLGGVACALPIAWSVRNAIVLGSATNRVAAWHPVGITHLRDGARAAWHWLAAEDVVHPLLTGAAAIVAAAVLVLPVVWNRRTGRTLPAVMAVFSLSFAALLTVSISLFDYHTPVDRRILSPVYAAWLVCAGCVLAEANRHGRAVKATAWVVAGAAALWSLERSRALAVEQFRDGAGYAHRIWRESPVLAALKETVPHEKWVYTNAPGALYLLTGRPAVIALPSKFSASSMRENPKYPHQFARMRDDVQSGRAALVYFSRYAHRRRYLPTEQELQQGLGLRLLARRSDGAVYDYEPAPTPAATATTAAAAPAAGGNVSGRSMTGDVGGDATAD